LATGLVSIDHSEVCKEIKRLSALTRLNKRFIDQNDLTMIEKQLAKLYLMTLRK